MEERILTGYCRCLDQSRMVTVEWEQSEPEADCSFAACPHRAACEIARAIEKARNQQENSSLQLEKFVL